VFEVTNRFCLEPKTTAGGKFTGPRGVVYKDPFKNVLWSSWISEVIIETKHKSEFSILRDLFGYLEANLPTPPFGNRTHYEIVLGKRSSYP
jgi:hypothetical protein